MKTQANRYRGYRFPPEIISHSVWLYHRFSLSFRDVEDLLAKRGIVVTYETIRQWCRKFGPEYARNLKRRQGQMGDVWHLDGYCQLELILARLDARPTKQTPEYSGFPLRGSRILSEIALKLTVPVKPSDSINAP